MGIDTAVGSSRPQYIRTSRTVIKRIIIYTLTCILCMFTLCACQPTPDKPIAQSKNDGELEQAVYGTTAPYGAYEAPEAWQESIEPTEKDFPNLDSTITIDAEIVIPDVTAFPVIRVDKAEITQKDADAFMNYFIGDADLYDIDLWELYVAK